MKKLMSLILALVMIVTCLAGMASAATVATVETNGKVVEAATMEDMLAAIDASGKSVVTLKADIVGTAQIKVPYSCTIDLNGFTWKTEGAGNALAVQAAGTENTQTYIKNGIVSGHVIGVRVNGGGLKLENCIVTAKGAVAVAMYETSSAYNEQNLITGCTIVGTINGCVGFNHQSETQTGCKMTIENTKLIEVKEAGAYIFTAKMGDGTMVLGKGVEMYSYKPDGYAQKTNVEGETLKAEFALASVEVPELNVKAAGMSYWHTPEYVAPAQPETPAAPAAPAEPAQPATPAAPSVPTTTTPDVIAPATGVSVVALGVMAMVSLAGAVITKKN